MKQKIGTNGVSVQNVTLILSGNRGDPDSRILLLLKPPEKSLTRSRRKSVIGSGLWVPPGGKERNIDKTSIHAAQRETEEETGERFPLRSFGRVGILRNYSGEDYDSMRLSRIVHLFIVENAHTVQLIPQEKFLAMKWFYLHECPYSKMWPSDQDWIPRAVNGENLDIEVLYGSESRTIKYLKVTPH
jgi:8-oxo-dGTP pyrophosphatase MutT (NUDIX family)